MMQNRKYIWCLKLGIGREQIQYVYTPFYNQLKARIIKSYESTHNCTDIKHIVQDVTRTFPDQKISKFSGELIK